MERHSRGRMVDSRTFHISRQPPYANCHFCVELAGLQPSRRRRGLLARHRRRDLCEESMGGSDCGVFTRGRPCRFCRVPCFAASTSARLPRRVSGCAGFPSLAPSTGVGASEIGRARRISSVWIWGNLDPDTSPGRRPSLTRAFRLLQTAPKATSWSPT